MKNQAIFRKNEEFIQFSHILQTTDGVVENFDETEKLIIHEKPRSKFTFSCNFATLTRTSGSQYDVRKSSKRKELGKDEGPRKYWDFKITFAIFVIHMKELVD